MVAKLFWLFVSSILYTYLGYPLLAALLAKLRPYRARVGQVSSLTSEAADLPLVTLLIAAYNEAEVISAKLKNSLALDYPRERLQVLVAADGSTDRTAEIVRTFADQGVELSYAPPRLGKMAAINRAVQQARGEIVVFSDANNLYLPDTLRELVKGFADPCVGAVTGAKTIQDGDGSLGESEGLYWKYEAFIRKQETLLGSTTGVAGEALAIRRDLFEAPPDDVINDDFYMAARLIRRGYRVIYAPAARSVERVSASAQDEVTRRTRIVAGRYQALAHAGRLLSWRQPLVAWQMISHKFMRPLVPLAMIGALAANLLAVMFGSSQRSDSAQRSGSSLLRLTGGWGRWMLLAQAVFYALAFLGGRVPKPEGKLGSLLYLPTFLVNSNLAALQGLYRYLTRQQTTRWQRVNRRHGTDMDTPREYLT